MNTNNNDAPLVMPDRCLGSGLGEEVQLGVLRSGPWTQHGHLSR